MSDTIPTIQPAKTASVILAAVFTALSICSFFYYFHSRISPTDAQGGIAVMFILIACLPVGIVAYCWFWSVSEIVFRFMAARRFPSATSASFVVPVSLFCLSSVIGFLAIATHVAREQVLRAAATSPVWERQAFLYEEATQPYDHDVMMRLADNPHASPDLLSLLAKDRHISVRMRVAKNARTPAKVLEALAEDPDRHVRAILVHNPSVPNQIIEKLRLDKDEYVSTKANYFAGKRGLP